MKNLFAIISDHTYWQRFVNFLVTKISCCMIVDRYLFCYISYVYSSGRWSEKGLTGSEINGRISCQSRHLTSFVILVDYTGVIAEQKVCACGAVIASLSLFVFLSCI